ncbi:MAG TPA: hypothetical protein VGJ86_09115 [Acidimicrobiales bacterium]|jgi:hypothetical protein
MIIGAITLMQLLWVRLQAVREDDRGMTTEAIIITSALAALAIVVTGLIVVGVRNEANTIRYDAPNP